jgi:hypothetical protein
MNELLRRSQAAVMHAERRAFDACSRAEEFESMLRGGTPGAAGAGGGGNVGGSGGAAGAGGAGGAGGHYAQLTSPLGQRPSSATVSGRHQRGDEVVSLRSLHQQRVGMAGGCTSSGIQFTV